MIGPEMAIAVFLTPIPMAVSTLALFSLWGSTRSWANIGRIACILIISFNAIYWHEVSAEKERQGTLRGEAISIAKLTTEIDKLLQDNQTGKAQEIIAKFSSQYPLVAGDHKKTEALLGSLMNEAQSGQRTSSTANRR